MRKLYLRGADFEQEELIDRGFAEEDNFLKHSLRISSLMSQGSISKFYFLLLRVCDLQKILNRIAR